MARYLTLSRAARLAGVKRGALQQRISHGDLPTFEGKIELSDLLRVYPQTRLDDTAELERVDRIKMKAVPRTMREHAEPPDMETLRARATRLGADLARAQAEAAGYRELIGLLRRRLQEQAGTPGIDGLRGWLEQALQEHARKASVPNELSIRDTMLRFFSAHVFLYPSQHDFFVEGNDTILEAGLRAGLALPYGCSDASCGRCRARLLAGKVRALREAPAGGAPDTILLCCHTAISDVELEVSEAQGADAIEPAALTAEVCKINRPRDDVAILDLKSPRSQRLRFLAGQYARLSVGDVPARSYAIASCPCDERQLQFHVPREEHNPFADYVFERLSLADTIRVEGPYGDFVLDEESPRSLVYLAWDTGFAPIKSLIENAMALDAAERVQLFWCYDQRRPYPYMHNLCRSWHDALDHFDYRPLAVNFAAPDAPNEALHELVEQVSDLSSFDFYVSGPETVVGAVRTFLRARGVPADQLKCQTVPPGD